MTTTARAAGAASLLSLVAHALGVKLALEGHDRAAAETELANLRRAADIAEARLEHLPRKDPTP